MVGLGTLGFVARVTLDVVPAFELRQYVFDGLPWATVEANLHELLALGYSTSLFTLWADAGIHQVWVKSIDALETCFGAPAADGPRHPIPARTRPTAPSSSACPVSRVSGCRTSVSGSLRAAATSSSRSTRSRASMPSTRCGCSARSGDS